MSGNEADEDLLGRTYEYCIAQFAEKEGVGGMFIQSAKFIQAHSGKRGAISVYGQEVNFGPYHADTFTNALHPDKY